MNNSKQEEKKTKDVELLDPNNSEDRKEIIRLSVEKTVEEYGEALKMLGDD